MAALPEQVNQLKTRQDADADDEEQNQSADCLLQDDREESKGELSEEFINGEKEKERENDQELIKSNMGLEIISEAWPEPEEIKVKSKVHSIIKKKIQNIDLDKLYYRQLDGNDLEEVKDLHEEWFPIQYRENFYNRIYKINVIAIGCFYPIADTMSPQEKLADGSTQSQEVLLGTIMTKIERETNEISEIYRAKETIRTFFGLGGWLYSFFCREHIGSYIMTIGVVDECRRFGLGSKLLDHTIRLLNVKWPQCEIIYLHVVDYNESAIKFYEKNNFSTLKKLKNHYSIFEKSYDAYTLYKDITPKPVKAEDNEKRSSGNV